MHVSPHGHPFVQTRPPESVPEVEDDAAAGALGHIPWVIDGTGASSLAAAEPAGGGSTGVAAAGAGAGGGGADVVPPVPCLFRL